MPIRFLDNATPFRYSVQAAHLEDFIDAWVLIEGLKRAGRQIDREGFVNTLNFGAIDLGEYKVNYAPDSHHGSKFVDLTVIGNLGHELHSPDMTPVRMA